MFRHIYLFVFPGFIFAAPLLKNTKMEDDTFKVYIYDSTSGSVDIKMSRIGFIPSSVDGSESVARANAAIYSLESSDVGRQFFLDLLTEGYLKGMCGRPGEIISKDFFSHFRDMAPIIIMITNDKMFKPPRPPRTPFLKTFLRSFILAKPEDVGGGSNTFYVDLICAKARIDAGGVVPDDTRYAGKTVMQVATAYAISKGYDEMALSSIPELLLLYPKWGFEFRTSCRKSALEIPDSLRRRRFLDTREDNPDENPIYAEDNKPFLDFMLSLREAGLEHEHPPLPKKGASTSTGLKKDAACKMALNPKELKEWGCEQDGYKMMKCNIRKK